MGLVSQFLEELKSGAFPIKSARRILSQLDGRMSADEKAEAITLISTQEASERIAGKRPSLFDIVPPGWLHDYLSFSQISEAPDAFHLFSGMAVLSHLISRRMWFPVGTLNLYPPLSIFLVSPAGQARRSSAVRTAVDIGRLGGASVIQDTMTPEGLIDWLRAEPSTLIVADEAATILSKTDYMSQMPQILCTLLDCPSVFQRKLKAEVVAIHRPTVNALIGCAPEWIETSMPKAALGGGLFSRMLLVYEENRKRLIPFPDDTTDAASIERMSNSLARSLAALTSHDFGLMAYTPTAKEEFAAFYADVERQMGEVNDRFRIYLSRKHVHLHRIVMSLLISGGHGNTANSDILARGLALLSFIERNMLRAYRTAGLEKPAMHQARVLRAVDRAGGRIDRSSLLRSVAGGLTARELDETIGVLVEMGALEVDKEITGKTFTIFYMSTNTSI